MAICTPKDQTLLTLLADEVIDPVPVELLLAITVTGQASERFPGERRGDKGRSRERTWLKQKTKPDQYELERSRRGCGRMLAAEGRGPMT